MRVDKTRIGFFIAGKAWQVSKAIKNGLASECPSRLFQLTRSRLRLLKPQRIRMRPYSGFCRNTGVVLIA
ncbi:MULTISPECIES: hypothetical protein [unclassified Paraburkholderia]|uniref:hypothetical protein n=1 Tax=unclassified Paraburkholderia TaxID=2615204 RepID=UPI00160C87D6|nr:MULTISPECIES: hypothetical protein [unclassified Paraburkholderia]MBB5441958.1 hypothetical protein [Paraburkholderia sp. WSM4177]MBB5482354.1 hypothetical protein [Paraburkholderia sp. WSM4180]